MDDLKKGDIVMNIFAGKRNPTRFLLYICKGTCWQGKYSQKVYNCIGYDGKKVQLFQDPEKEALIANIKNLPTCWADAGGVYGRSMKYPEGMFDCEDVISSVENAPAADVAPVVRCKACKYYKPDEYECGCDFAGGLPYVKENDFCSYGKRKDGDDNAAD